MEEEAKEIPNQGKSSSKKEQLNTSTSSLQRNYSNYPNQMRPSVPTSRDVMETCIIKNLISSYYHVVKKNINDLVPKTVMCFLVNQSKLLAEKEMVSQLYKSNELETLLQEDPYIAKKRKSIKDSLNNLKSSLDVLSEFNSLSLDN
jgi:dynamin 1-like protein